MEIQQPIKYKKTQNSDDDKNITVEINKIIEKMILKNPNSMDLDTL